MRRRADRATMRRAEDSPRPCRAPSRPARRGPGLPGSRRRCRAFSLCPSSLAVGQEPRAWLRQQAPANRARGEARKSRRRVPGALRANHFRGQAAVPPRLRAPAAGRLPKRRQESQQGPAKRAPVKRGRRTIPPGQAWRLLARAARPAGREAPPSEWQRGCRTPSRSAHQGAGKRRTWRRTSVGLSSSGVLLGTSRSFQASGSARGVGPEQAPPDRPGRRGPGPGPPRLSPPAIRQRSVSDPPGIRRPWAVPYELPWYTNRPSTALASPW